MKIYYFCLLLLFMEIGCYADVMDYPLLRKIPTTTTLPTNGTSTNETTTPSTTEISTTNSPALDIADCEEEPEPEPIPSTEYMSMNMPMDISEHFRHFSPPIPSDTKEIKPLNQNIHQYPAVPATFVESTLSSFDYKVCGARTFEEYEDPDCSCWNNTLTCSPKTDCYGWSCPDKATFNSLNIKIMQANFTVKIVFFQNNNLNILQKGKVLPGNEHTVEVLQLSGNKITYIENGAFDNFTALKELNLSMNEQLGQYELFSKFVFPKALGNLTKLTMTRCGITAISDQAFVNLVSLEKLLLYGNPITSFPRAVNSLQNLRHLNLDETQITSLNCTGSNQNPKLEKLYLTKTSLAFIDDCAFCNFPNLKELRLYQNFNLTFIHENAFGYAYNGTSPPLEKFSLEYCNLQTIPENLLNWHTIKKFGLGNNPFMCNCSMAWLINDILSPTHTINLQKVAPHPFMTFPSEIAEMELPSMYENGGMSEINMDHPPGVELPYPTYTGHDPSQSEPMFYDDGLKCFGPHALKHVKFIQISKNFCPNVAKNEQQNCQGYSTLAGLSTSHTSWFHVVFVTTIFLLGIVVGGLAYHFGRYIYRKRKGKYGFDQFSFRENSTIQEDFDEGKY